MTKKAKRLVHEGEFVAEVEVDLEVSDEAWAPYLRMEDVERLDRVRQALRDGDLRAASRIGRVFQLTPVDL
jgi:hypothetical protein